MSMGRLCIIGVGLMGGSLALALRQAGYCRDIVGSSRRVSHLKEALALGVIDRYELDPRRAVAGADIVLLATPLGAMREVLAQIKDGLDPDTVITDVGSAKGSVVRAVQAVYGEMPAHFVPGHPIAGTEKSGVGAAFADLYRDRRVLLTPVAQTSASATERVQKMWEAAGAIVEALSVEHHDEVLAATSHLPHMLAFGLVDSLARMGDKEEIFRYAAGGFRDFTRIASSDPVMWRDICLTNREAILAMMQRYREDLAEIETAIERSDAEALLAIFSRAKAARDRFCG